MAQRWFVSQKDRVYGPWSTDDVQAHRRQGNVGDADLIWGGNLAHWVTLAKWNSGAASTAPRAAITTKLEVETKVAPTRRDEAETRQVMIAKATEAETRQIRVTADEAETRQIVADETDGETKIVQLRTDDAETRVIATDDTAATVQVSTGELWHYAVAGASHGPYSRAALAAELRRLPNLHGVSLWTRGMREWVAAFEFHDIATEVGMNLREHPRAAISGRAVMKYDGLTLVAPLASISEGGLGLQLNSEFFAGQRVSVEIQADPLGAPLTLDAEVRYSAGGIVGLRFLAAPSAARGQIAGYVRKHPPAAARAA